MVRRHGPAAPIWRRRIALGLGAVSVGLAALLFARLADSASHIFTHHIAKHWWLPLIITPAGFALIAWCTRTFAPETAGSGIPQVIAATRDPPRAVRLLIPLRAAVMKLILTVAALLVGGSVGREGPTVQISAAIMAGYHRLLQVPLRASVIIAGGAAGVAAAFNTPLAGLTFAIEELADAYEQRMALLAMTTILIAGMVSLGLAGDYVYFGFVRQTMHFSGALRVAPIAGIVGGLTGGLFARMMLDIDRYKDRWIPAMRDQPVRWAMLCGTVVALTGVSTGLTWGTGYEAAHGIIEGTETPYWYGPSKLIATLATAVAGIPGGIFAPSLSAGAGLGAILKAIFPDEPGGAVVLLGMVAYFTGVVRAPLTAVIIIVEATASRGLILPLFTAALIAHGTSRLVCKERLYHGLAQPWHAKLAAETKKAGKDA